MVEKRRRSPHPLLSPLPLPPRRFASRRCHRSRPPAAVSWAPGTAGGGDLDLDLSLGCFNGCMGISGAPSWKGGGGRCSDHRRLASASDPGCGGADRT
uniref:Uncharacterized protein n=1 Tax=Oryza barthii TaxID=65489 RepID=A0A0D3HTQ6_9ORYZ